MTMYEKIKALCRQKGFEISNLDKHIQGVKIKKGAISKWKTGSTPRADTLKAIADYFGVTPESLASDESVNIESIQDNHGIIGHTHAPVTIINGSERKLTEQAIELLNIFDKLSVVDQAKLLVYANELQNK